MFTFHWTELLVIVFGGLILFFGLALLMLHRRNEILEDLLTPEEPNLEIDFFGARAPKQKKKEDVPSEEDTASPEPSGTEEASPEQPEPPPPATPAAPPPTA